MATFRIPLVTTPQQFEIQLVNKNYLITCKWNDAEEGGWVLDFDDATNNTPIIHNVPLVTGTDLLVGLEYLGFEGSLFVFTDGDDDAVPTFTNLGVESNLYFQTDVVT